MEQRAVSPGPALGEAMPGGTMRLATAALSAEPAAATWKATARDRGSGSPSRAGGWVVLEAGSLYSHPLSQLASTRQNGGKAQQCCNHPLAHQPAMQLPLLLYHWPAPAALHTKDKGGVGHSWGCYPHFFSHFSLHDGPGVRGSGELGKCPPSWPPIMLRHLFLFSWLGRNKGGVDWRPHEFCRRHQNH